MFYGAPGNGKSTLAHALAKELGMSIYLLDLHTVASDFPKFISSIEPNSVILIEDIDTFFNGRKSVNDNKVNFSTFINALNGISTIENVVTVFTTNHPENLDPALTRDGRCDFKLELKNPTKPLVEEFLTHVFEKPVTLSSYTPNKSFSQVQNIVLRNIANLEKVKQELSGAS
jgi:chaperone BCS1